MRATGADIKGSFGGIARYEFWATALPMYFAGNDLMRVSGQESHYSARGAGWSITQS